MNEAFELSVTEAVSPNISSLEIREILDTTGGRRFIGHFVDTQSNLLTVKGSPYVSNHAGGFILDETGSLLRIARPCPQMPDGTAQEGDEVFFFGATNVENDMGPEYVVVGAMEAPRVAVSGSDAVECGFGSGVDGPADAGDTMSPMIIWFRDSNDGVSRSRAANPPATTEHGFLSDVVGVPSSTNGQVVAIGLASQDPFFEPPADSAFGGTLMNYQYYLVKASAPAQTEVRSLGRYDCHPDSLGTFNGLRSSLASDPDGQIWAAGTGCPTLAMGQDLGFLMPLGADHLTPISTRVIGDENTEMSVTEVAASMDHVIVAGSFTGTPYDFGITGDMGDGYVLAFNRLGYTNNAEPKWFTRITSENGPAKVEALLVVDGHVFVSGKVASDGGVGPLVSCALTDTPSGGRAFTAMLNEENGFLEWFRIDGMQLAADPDPLPAFANTTALAFGGGVLFAATQWRGADGMVLGCESNSATDLRPRATVRQFTPGPAF